jgi:hypothetical protein
MDKRDRKIETLRRAGVDEEIIKMCYDIYPKFAIWKRKKHIDRCPECGILYSELKVICYVGSEFISPKHNNRAWTCPYCYDKHWIICDEE